MTYTPVPTWTIPKWIWVNQGGFTRTFNAGTGPDADGLEWWIPKEPKGWRGPGAVRPSYLIRPGEDGNWPAEVRLNAKAVTVEGTVFAQDDVGVDKAREYLAELAIEFTRDGILERQFTSPGGYATDLFAFIRIETPMTLTEREDVYGIDFQQGLTFYDPRRYAASGAGVHDVTGTSLTVANDGSVYTPVLMTVTGAANGSTLTLGSGQQIKFTSAFGAIPSPLVINTRTKEVVDGGGVSRYFAIQSADYFWVKPGGDTLVMAGGGSVEVVSRDAWL